MLAKLANMAISANNGDFGELLLNHQIYVNQFNTWWPAMLANMAISANMAILANSCQITKFM